MQDITGFRTYVEEIPEHDCQLDTKDVAEQVLFGDGIPSRRRRFLALFQRTMLLSRKHPYTTMTFKSTNSMSLEITRHWKIAPYTIHPYSVFRSNWEIAMIFYYMIHFVSVPFLVTFHGHHIQDFQEGIWSVVTNECILFVVLVFGYVEMIVTFFTGYVSSDGLEFVLEKRRIAKHYFKTYFLIDFLSAFPYGFVLVRSGILPVKYYCIEYISCLKMVRIFELLKYYRQMAKRWNWGYVVRNTISVLVLLILYLLIATSLLLMTSLVAMDPDIIHDKQAQLEAEKLPPDQQSWFVKVRMPFLERSQIWRLAMMRAVCLTMGCRAPYFVSQINDILGSMIFSLLGIVVTSIAAVHVVATTRTASAGTALFEELQTQLREYLLVKKVPRTLYRRIGQYFRFCYERSFFKEPTILSFLSGQLRQDVLLHRSRRLLETVEIFSDLPPLLAVRLISCMREQVALQNEVVARAGALGDSMYYIMTGTVAVYNEAGVELLHLGEGDHFGEAALVADDVTTYLSVVALEPTRMWTLTRDAFRRALAPDKTYQQRVEQLAQLARVRQGLLSGAVSGAFLAPMVPFVQHLRRTHRAAQEERRKRGGEGSAQKSFLEHDQRLDNRASVPFPRLRRLADVATPTPPPSVRRKGTPPTRRSSVLDRQRRRSIP